MTRSRESIAVLRKRGNARSRWTLRLLLGIGLVAVAIYLVLPPGRAGDVSYLAISLGAGAAAWAGWLRVRGAAAALIAAGVSLSAAGDLTHQVLAWATGEEPAISVDDIGWLGAYVAIGAALLLVIRNEGQHRLDADAWIDIAADTIFVLLLQWQLAPGGLISDSGSPPLTRVVWALYPVFNSVLVALVVRAVLARRLDRAAAALLVGGSGCWVASEVFFTVLSPSTGTTTWMHAGWLLGAVLLASAAWQPPLVGHAVKPVLDDDRRVGDGRITVPMLPLALPGAIEIAGWLRGNDPNPFPLPSVTVAFLVLALLGACGASHRRSRRQRHPHLPARHHAASELTGPPRQPGVPRRTHRFGEPSTVLGSCRARPSTDCPNRSRARRDLAGPRPSQAGQRHPRPRGGRRSPARGCSTQSPSPAVATAGCIPSARSTSSCRKKRW